MSDEKRTIGLRIKPDTVEQAHEKFGEGAIESEFLDTLIMTNVPFSLVAMFCAADVTLVRDCITARKPYPADGELHAKINTGFKKLLDSALKQGLLPCKDIAVVKPILELLLRNLYLEAKYS